MTITTIIKAASRAAARELLFGASRTKAEQRRAVREKAAQLRAEMADIQRVRAALAYERAYPAVAAELGVAAE